MGGNGDGNLPPGPRERLPWSGLMSYRRDPTGYLTRLAREYGDVASLGSGRRRMYLLSRPEYVQEVLVTHSRQFVKSRALERSKIVLGEGLLTSEGDLHRRQRRLVQPAFHRDRVLSYAGVMTGQAARTSESWRDGLTLDVFGEMSSLTLAIAGETLFGADLRSEAAEVGEALSVVMGYFRTMLLPFSDLLLYLPLPAVRRFDKARRRLDQTVYRIIDARRQDAEGRSDLISTLLLAQDSEQGGGGMTDALLRDEAITLLLAGHETTAVALTWTWYLLSQHPEVEEKLHTELDTVLGGRAPTADDLPRLEYTRRVITESMRLYPPAWAVGRRALVDYEAGGYVIPAGSVVIASQFVIHRDPRYFPEPLRFEPDRWTAEGRASLPRFAYFPFGGGPRLCVGEQFAWMEAVLVLAALAREWRAKPVPGHPVELQPLITLRPRHGMRMTLERQ